MIIEIISHMNEIKDLRNCMMLCKEIREMMFMMPKIMKKIQVVFQDFNYDEIEDLIFQFLYDKGRFIKNLSLFLSYKDPEFLPYVLNQVPNLEKLILNSKFDYYNDEIKQSEYFFRLPRLKNLIVYSDEFEIFMTNAIDLQSLEKLEINYIENVEMMTDFLCQLDTLKIFCSNSSSNYYLTRNISKEMKFKLSTIEFYLHGENDNFQNFLECQADNLRKLNLFGYLSAETINIIFEKCKNLQMLILKPYDTRMLRSSRLGIIENLTYFEVSNKYGSELNFICKSLPHLKILKCTKMCSIKSSIDNLVTLEIQQLECKNLQNLKLPKLKNLTAEMIRIKKWEKFIQNVPNLESLTIKNIEIQQISIILKSVEKLKYFKHLKLN